MKFSRALEQLEINLKVYRKGWNGTQRGIDMYVKLVKEHSYAPHFVFVNSELGTTNIWVPSMWDIMAEDWEIRLKVD